MVTTPIKKTLDKTIAGIGGALPGFGMTTEQAKEKVEASRKAQCEAAGGVWDGTRCVFPKKPEQVPETTDKKTELPAGAGGKKVDILSKDGKQFVIPPKETRALAATGKAEGIMTSEQIIQQAEQVQQQSRNAELLQMAQQGLLTPQELQAIQGAKLDIGQAVGAGAISAVPGIVGGAVSGATIGALGGPVGAVGGAVIGAIGSFLIGMRSNIKGQQVDQFAKDQTALSRGQTMLRSLITDTNQNPQNAPENIALFYQTLNMIDAAHAKTWKDSQEDLNRFLGNDGSAQLAKFEVFDATMRQYYIQRFETALLQPNPSEILLTGDDLEGGFE